MTGSGKSVVCPAWGVETRGSHASTYPEAISTRDCAMASRCRLVRFKVARATLPVLPLVPRGLAGEPTATPAGVLAACRWIGWDGVAFTGPRMVPMLSRSLAPGPGGGGGSLTAPDGGTFLRTAGGCGGPAALTLITRTHCGQEQGGPGGEAADPTDPADPGLAGQDWALGKVPVTMG